jgi:hypothetical protein
MGIGMRRIIVVLVLATGLLAGASIARGADIGANDDTAKYHADGGAAFYGEMAALGLRQVVIPVRFKPSDPMTIQDKALLDRTIPAAQAAGLKVVLAVYPYPTRELEAGLASPSLFGSYAGAVASIYPEVKEFVVGNEPNQPAFWRPQFSPKERILSAPAFGQYLATAYDSLKAVDPSIKVVGVGLSPRGNDRPRAKSNISISPVRFLRALGTWYRASGRDLPLMDAFSFHPYPNNATDPLARGYSWPNAGFVNADRIKQALWDAFDGTPQPTTLGGLKLHLDEVGWQVGTDGREGYTGLENVAVTDEVTQAAIYGELVRRASCDPDIAQVSFFGFRDDGARAGFQAALQRLDGSPRPAAEAVRVAIGDTSSGCSRSLVSWKPHTQVLNASVKLRRASGAALAVRVAAGEDARALVCLTSRKGRRSAFRGSLRSSGARCRAAAVVGHHPLDLALRVRKTGGGGLEVAVELAAEANRKRKTILFRRATTSRKQVDIRTPVR